MPSTICSTSQRCRLLKSFFYCMTLFVWGFPHSSVGKESSCNAGDLTSIPGSRRSAGEGIGYPLQYSWASLVALLVKTPPAVWETWVRSLDWEDPLEKGTANHSSILAWRIPQSIGSQRVRQDWTAFTFTFTMNSPTRRVGQIGCVLVENPPVTWSCFKPAMIRPNLPSGLGTWLPLALCALALPSFINPWLHQQWELCLIFSSFCKCHSLYPKCPLSFLCLQNLFPKI